ncbi:Hsp20/alpha crystallin family protein [Bacillus sp. AK128]
MNPMDFFKGKDGFPFNAIPESQFNPEDLYDLKKMVKQYHSMLNEDFWSDIHGMRVKKNKREPVIPIEVWENDKFVYLSVICPGLPDIKYARIQFQNDQDLKLILKSHSIKPEGATTLLSSELPQNNFEREIHLKKSVVTTDYSSSFEDGVLSFTFIKIKDEIEIPFDF